MHSHSVVDIISGGSRCVVARDLYEDVECGATPPTVSADVTLSGNCVVWPTNCVVHEVVVTHGR